MSAAAELGRVPLVGRRRSRRPPLVLIAAHPDDETIGASSLLLRSPGCVVVHVTDGAPLDVAFWPEGVAGDRAGYAALRRAELNAAMRVAGIAESQLVQLGARDQEAVRELVPLTLALADLLAKLRPRRVVTHPYEGGHPDHDASAFISRAALALNARCGIAAPPLYEMTSYHARSDGSLETCAYLEPATAPIHTRVLSAIERDAKERMLAAHQSQREIIAWFPRELERLRRAPDYDFTRPPHPGPLWYERMGFPLSGDAWRAAAAHALGQLEGLDARAVAQEAREGRRG